MHPYIAVIRMRANYACAVGAPTSLAGKTPGSGQMTRQEGVQVNTPATPLRLEALAAQEINEIANPA